MQPTSLLKCSANAEYEAPNKAKTTPEVVWQFWRRSASAETATISETHAEVILCEFWNHHHHHHHDDSE